ncbi:DUF3784 domain-containing protein [Myroides marinus]|uniref:DUF3784 domain-containing protein n=1 Tax=Myroides marinus TaxID=703342 RepID=UPI000742192D|nr:DUF3784 domain-containing protein [Myroides marinus]KUF39405.1 hypothetical protein AS361_02160 [Myroides marinus]MDM1345846.1 DUF3784 domain-containing protein [Myroides marinus]MDM1349293.1 DUF3784 domain-containing protein [Myroides marinus]MDM1353029.1 DUF3784 domain-containing protein [Myroides marinus]MDM1356503.1 DUF3784 domain-containing protein [Myroides marinus]
MEAFIITGLLYIGISYFLTPDNADSLLAGYNTMSDERKKLYDITSTVKMLNLTMRWSGISTSILAILAIVFKWPIAVIISILICILTIPSMIMSIYTRLKYSEDPMRWYDWLAPIGMIVGSLVLAYYIN